MDPQQPREGSDEDTREHAPTPPESRTAEDVVREQELAAEDQSGAGQSPTPWASQQDQQPPAAPPPGGQPWQQPPAAPPPGGQPWQQPPAAPPPGGQPWQQPPAGQQWQQPPAGQQWQQPPAGPQWQQGPAWAGQPGWGSYGQRARYDSSAMVVIAGIVLIIFGALFTFVGAIGLLVGGVIEEAIRQQAVQPTIPLQGLGEVVAVIAGVVLVIGILHVISAIGIFLHRQWGRIIGIVLAALMTLLWVLGVVTGAQAAGQADIVIPLVIAIGYGFSLFALIAGGRHFNRVPA